MAKGRPLADGIGPASLLAVRCNTNSAGAGFPAPGVGVEEQAGCRVTQRTHTHKLPEPLQIFSSLSVQLGSPPCAEPHVRFGRLQKMRLAQKKEF